MQISNVFCAFLLSLLAGLSTGIGSLVAFFAKKTNRRFLSASLGFSAGVMLFVSFAELYRQAQELLSEALGEQPGAWVTALAFFGGIAVIALIDRLIPEENPRGGVPMQAGGVEARQSGQLLRTGLVTALTIALHNFPEGLATFVSSLQEPELAVPIVTAIAIHNIPEGIAVSVPIYQATGSRRRAFLCSFLSGLAEPVGALLGWLVLLPILNDAVYGAVFAAIAGIMVFISVDELLPAAQAYGEHHLSVCGLVCGMAVMAVSLLLL